MPERMHPGCIVLCGKPAAFNSKLLHERAGGKHNKSRSHDLETAFVIGCDLY